MDMQNVGALLKPASDVRELSTSELADVSGGFVEVIAMVVASNYAYYQWLKKNNKI
jgi:hypothetical protein